MNHELIKALRKMLQASIKDRRSWERLFLRGMEVLANKHDGDAAMCLGIYYLTGILYSPGDIDDIVLFKRRNKYKDSKKAERFLRIAWKSNIKQSAYYLSWLFFEMQLPSKAYYWASKAVKHVGKDFRAICYHTMGYLLYNYCSCATAPQRGIANWRKAAKLGSAQSMLELGTIYFYGENVERDGRLATVWLRKCINSCRQTGKDKACAIKAERLLRRLKA
jgi:TPR repeat protein